MIADLPSCEWHPASNRSLVDPVVAVARLDMPVPTRTALVEKLRRHQFDDVVHIDWAQIASESGTNRYGPAITNMNFGASGRLCRTVTRASWSELKHETALVYIVDGRAWGYASACGNLFELKLLPPVPAVPESAGGGVVAASGVPALVAPFVPAPPVAFAPVEWLPPVVFWGPPIFFPPVFYNPLPPVWVKPPPTPPVPESPAWLLFILGILAICARGWLR